MAQIVPRKTYGWTWFALLVLLCATWLLSRFDLKPFNAAIALGIASAKMMLILLYFMHLRYRRRLIWVFAGAGFVWLLILIELTLSDYLTRGSAWSQ